MTNCRDCPSVKKTKKNTKLNENSLNSRFHQINEKKKKKRNKKTDKRTDLLPLYLDFQAISRQILSHKSFMFQGLSILPASG